MHGKSSQDVYDIIADSRQEPQVELIVSRIIAANRRAAQASWRQSHSPNRFYHTSGITTTKKIVENNV